MSNAFNNMELTIGVIALGVALIMYSFAHFWRTKEGWVIFLILLNFLLIKFFTLLIITHTVDREPARDIIFTLVMFNCLAVLWFMLIAQRRFPKWLFPKKVKKDVH